MQTNTTKRASVLGVVSGGLAAFALAGAAQAQAFSDAEPYISGTIGGALLSDSDNAGAFVGDFTTGEGVAVPAGTVLPDGTSLGWTTEFDAGLALSGAVGLRSGPWRGEIEVAYQQNDVDTHVDVQAGGGALGAADAGVLITGSDALGVTVADLVADGRGEVSTTFVMLNGYYDFDTGGPIAPYVGAGIGFAMANVEYAPSGVGIIDDDNTGFAYQFIAGATIPLGDRWEGFGQYRYRASEDISTDVDLFSATLDVENQANIFEVGVRLNF